MCAKERRARACKACLLGMCNSTGFAVTRMYANFSGIFGNEELLRAALFYSRNNSFGSSNSVYRSERSRLCERQDS